MFRYFYVYILICNDDSFYTGITNDLEKRIVEHNTGINHKAYTYSRRPVKCVFHELYSDPDVAILVEKQIKGWTRKKKEALINNDYNALHELAKCINETTHVNNKKA